MCRFPPSASGRTQWRRGIDQEESATEAELTYKRTTDTLTANYQIKFKTVDGFTNVNEAIVFEIGQNNVNLQDFIMPWDTAYGSGNLITFDAQNIPNKAKFTPLTMEAQQMNDFLIPTMIQLNSGNVGGINYTNLPTAVDTTGNPASGTAIYKVSWPFVPNPWLDSNSVNATHFGWEADDTLVNIHDGNNANINLLLNRVPTPTLIGKRRLEFTIGKLLGQNYTRHIADSVLIAIRINSNTQIDSIYTDSTGYAITPRYHHGDTAHIAFGYNGGADQNGDSLKSYKFDWSISGNTLNTIATGDTTDHIKANLVPDELWQGMTSTTVNVTAAEIKEMDENPQVQAAKFDTIGYYINPIAFNTAEQNFIVSIADSASAIGPVEYVRKYTQFTNPTYNPTTATTFSHGANVMVNGNNNITNIHNYLLNIPGASAMAIVNAQINIVNWATDETWKKLVFQYTGHDGVPVATRTSVMNGNPSFPTPKDFAIYTIKHHVEKQMFIQTPTQNIGFDYVFDDNGIVP